MSRPITWLQTARPHDLKIRAAFGNDLGNKMHDSVAWQAFQHYEKQGCESGHDVEHWKRAYSEMVRPLDCGVIVQNHRVCLTADASIFDDGMIEIYVAAAHALRLRPQSHTHPAGARRAGHASPGLDFPRVRL